jgi:hypothetical protein
MQKNYLTFKLLRGAFSGLIGGIVFAVWAIVATNIIRPLLGLETPNIILEIASIVGSTSVGVGAMLHLVISAIIGATFAVLKPVILKPFAPNLNIGVAGALYGTIWWLLGTLTLLPLFTGGGMVGVLEHFSHAVPNWLPSLIGHLLYGLTTALVWQFFSKERPEFTKNSDPS